jgi:low temperature requirement protein LtrA
MVCKCQAFNDGGLCCAVSQLHIRLTERPIDQPSRASTKLEPLFNITFAVAVVNITTQLSRSISAGAGIDAIAPFLTVFFAIWWAWMNFTWFAAAYETDDVLYRLLTFVQMVGVFVIASGTPAAFNESDFLGVTIGYFIMRVGLVANWARAAIEVPAGRTTALRYAVGISVLDACWILRQAFASAGLLPDASLLPVFLVLALLEMAVPPWAERSRPTSWHPEQIAQRYGQWMTALLAGSVFAASDGVEAALEAGGVSTSLLVIGFAGLVLLFALWWIYFLEPAAAGLIRHRSRSYVWGYGHYGIFAALTALGAGLAVAVEQTALQVEITSVAVAYVVAISVSVFLVLVAALNSLLGQHEVISPQGILVGAGIILLLPLAADNAGLAPVITMIAAICCLLIVVMNVVSYRRPKQPPAALPHQSP